MIEVNAPGGGIQSRNLNAGLFSPLVITGQCGCPSLSDQHQAEE
jgi:hypothetical protein